MNDQRWQNWLTTLIGVWVFLTPNVLPSFFPDAAVTGLVPWNHYIVGLAIAATGIAAIIAYQFWEEWIGMLLGLWLVASPWLLGFSNVTSLTVNDVATGVAVMALSGWVLTRADATTTT